MIEELFAIIEERKRNRPEGSYTAHLLESGLDRILRKIGEESLEVTLAAKGEGKQRLVEEVADLLYHVLVLLAALDLSPADIEQELRRRHRSG